jgi:hypothetical protein
MFVHMNPAQSGAWVDGDPAHDRDTDANPYWLALWTLVWALTVSSIASGRPRPSELRQAVTHARALREFDRHDLFGSH